MWDEDDRPNGPLSAVIVQDEEIWSSIFEDRSFHFGIGRIENLASEGFRLALQLKCGTTQRTLVVKGGGIARRHFQTGRLARRTEEVDHAPSFRANSGTLRRALISIESLNGEM